MRRKCYSCGKMATNPYTFDIVPIYNVYENIPIYSKKAKKTKRSDLKGDRKVSTYNYCNRECYENRKPQETYKI
jgi:hypothetical protein